jgi:hypothetical protein
LDHSSSLIRVVDLPAWRRGGSGNIGEKATAELPPVLPSDALPAHEAELEQLGIEIDGGTYCPAGRGGAPRWEFSPSLGRLCGSVLLVGVCQPGLPAFAEYLLRLNRDLRFARIGYLGRGIALQVVLCAGDRRWLALAQNALNALQELLRPQVAWWNQPRELVADLFCQATYQERRDSENEKKGEMT